MKKDIIQTAKIIILGIILSAGFAFAQAWTGPTGTPPTNNAPAPINVSGSVQAKSGSIIVGAPDSTYARQALAGYPGLFTGYLLADDGIISFGTSNLVGPVVVGQVSPSIKSDLTVTGSAYIKTIPNQSSEQQQSSQVCVGTGGQLVLCPPTTPTTPATPAFRFDGTYSEKAVFTGNPPVQSWVCESGNPFNGEACGCQAGDLSYKMSQYWNGNTTTGATNRLMGCYYNPNSSL